MKKRGLSATSLSSTKAGMTTANKSGKGDFVYPNGDVFRGNFDRDSREGFGIFVSFSKNFVYRGDFKTDQIKGSGICLFSNGMVVDGFFNGVSSLGNPVRKRTSRTTPRSSDSTQTENSTKAAGGTTSGTGRASTRTSTSPSTKVIG